MRPVGGLQRTKTLPPRATEAISYPEKKAKRPWDEGGSHGSPGKDFRPVWPFRCAQPTSAIWPREFRFRI